MCATDAEYQLQNVMHYYRRMRELGKFTVKAGLHDKLEKNSTRYQEMKVQAIIPHPEYETCKHYNDIALIHLQGSFRITPYVHPICVATEPLPSGSECLLSGWGELGRSTSQY